MTVIKELRDKIARLGAGARKDAAEKAGKDRKISAMEAAIKEMVGAMAEMKRCLDYYENPFSPPSKDSIPTRQRKAEAQKKAGKGSGAPAPHMKAPGRRRGHAGVSHHRSPDRTEHHRPERCGRCGGGHREAVGLRCSYPTKNMGEMPYT